MPHAPRCSAQLAATRMSHAHKCTCANAAACYALMHIPHACMRTRSHGGLHCPLSSTSRRRAVGAGRPPAPRLSPASSAAEYERTSFCAEPPAAAKRGTGSRAVHRRLARGADGARGRGLGRGACAAGGCRRCAARGFSGWWRCRQPGSQLRLAYGPDTLRASRGTTYDPWGSVVFKHVTRRRGECRVCGFRAQG